MPKITHVPDTHLLFFGSPTNNDRCIFSVYNMQTQAYEPCDDIIGPLANCLHHGIQEKVKSISSLNDMNAKGFNKYASIRYKNKVYVLYIIDDVLTIREYHIHQHTITYRTDHCKAGVSLVYDYAVTPPYLHIFCKTTGKKYRLYTLCLHPATPCYTPTKEILSKEAIRKREKIDSTYKQAITKTKQTDLANKVLQLIQTKKSQQAYLKQCKKQLALLEKAAPPYDDACKKREKSCNALQLLFGCIGSIARTNEEGIWQMEQSTRLENSLQKIDLLHYMQDVLSDVGAANFMLSLVRTYNSKPKIKIPGKKELSLWFYYLLGEAKEYLEKDLEEKHVWGTSIDIKLNDRTLVFTYPRHGKEHRFAIPMSTWSQLLAIVTKKLEALKSIQTHHEKIACTQHKQQQVARYLEQIEAPLQKAKKELYAMILKG